MIDVKFLEQFVKQASESNTSLSRKNYPNFISYLSDCRTFGLNLPRCTGKTEALEAYAETRSALRYNGVRHRFVSRFTNNFHDDHLALPSFRGQRSNGMKYQCCVADEFKSKQIIQSVQYFWAYIQELKICNMLTDDFYILYVGTER